MMRSALIGGMLWATVAGTTPVLADQPSLILVEEDWELAIGTPEPASCSPQITFFLSPQAETDGTYFQLQMNYAADKDFSSGGFHVAAVRNENLLDEKRSAAQSILQSEGDKVRWTSVMACEAGQLYYAIKDGHCAQWGSFGGPEYLVSMDANGLEDLSAYEPGKSISAVDIGFGANRVQRVRLREVRLLYSDGTVTSLTPES